MTDREFWDRYLSSLEDLAEEPPPSVKEGVFREMDRWRRRRRRLWRGGYTLLALLFLGSTPYLFTLFSGDLEERDMGSEGVAIWDPQFPGLENEKAIWTEEGEAEEEKGNSSKELQAQETTDAGSSSERKAASGEREDPLLAEKEKGSVSRTGAMNENSAQKEGMESHSAPPEERSPSNGAADQAEKVNKEENKKLARSEEKMPSTSQKEELQKQETLEKLPPKIPEAQEEEFKPDGELQENEVEEMMQASLSDQRFFAGADVLFNFTRVMDDPTLESFDEGSLVSTDPDLFLDFALSAGVNLFPRSRVRLSYFTKKDFGQEYHQYQEGRYRTQNVQLSYRSLDLHLEHDLLVGTPDEGYRSMLSVYGGGHYGQLRQAIKTEDGHERSIEEEIEPAEYGVDLGIRAGIRTMNGFDFGLQLGSSYSLNDITGSNGAPSLSTGEAKNLSLGAGVSLRYHFGAGL